jgi:serine/threonine protein kinase
MAEANWVPTDNVLLAYGRGTLTGDESIAVARWLKDNPEGEERLRKVTENLGESSLLILGASGPNDVVPGQTQISRGGESVLLLTPSPNPADATVKMPEAIREYVLIKQLGQGGMGSVFLARHRRLQRDVALKILPPQLAGDLWYRGRFEREMAAVGGLDHPNLVRAYDAGVEGDHLFLSMEFLEGEDLAKLVSRTGPLSIPDACEAIRQAAMGLHDAHERGLVHRDIKPANLFLTRNGIVKVIDLGLSRVLSREGAQGDQLSTAKTLVGTPEFMAPEQWESTEVDRRADIYGLGCTLHHLLTGSPPFGKAAGAWAQIAVLHCMQPPPSLRDAIPSVPRALNDLFARLLAKSPNDRPANAAEVAEALVPFTVGHHLVAVQTGQERRPTPVLQRVRKRGWLPITIGVVIACLLGVGIWQFSKPSPSPVAKQPPSDQPPPTPTPKIDPPEVAPTPKPPPIVYPILLHPAKKLLQHTDGVTTVAFSPNGKVLASGSKDKTILLWDTDTWKTRPPLEGHRGDLSSVAFSPDGSQLASVSSRPDSCIIRFWDVETATAKRTVGGENPGMWQVVWSADGKTLACGGWNRSLHIWDADKGKERFVIPDVIAKWVRGVAISRDGKQLVTGGGNDAMTRVWDATTGEEIPTERKLPEGFCPYFVPGVRPPTLVGLLQLPEGPCPLFLPGAELVAGWVYTHGRVTVCEVPSGQIRGTWKAHPRSIEGLAVSPDGRFLVSLGGEGIAKVWSLADLTEIATLVGHKGPIYGATFTSDGKRLATAGLDDATVCVWELPEICHVRK